MISKTKQVAGREPFVVLRSNKWPPPAVKLLHKKEHWLTKAKDNYERNYISENIGRGLQFGRCHCIGSNFNDGHDNEGRCGWGDSNHCEYHDRIGNNYDLRAGDRLHHVPRRNNRSADPVLLYE